MKANDNAFRLTREQLDIWLAQQTGHSDLEWQVGVLVKIEGALAPDLLEQAIRRVVGEIESVRAAFFEVDGEVSQRVVEHPNFDVPHYDVRCSRDPVQEVYRLTASIRRTPMSLAGPLFKFASFQARPNESYLFICLHHIVADGFSCYLIANRVAAVYSALVAGMDGSPAFLGSLRDLICREEEYEASNDYREDLTYWTENIPFEDAPDYGFAQPADEYDSGLASARVPLDPSIIDRIQGLSQALGVRPASIITAACALLVRGWFTSGDSSLVVFDFPVSRRVGPDSGIPGMVSGVVPLVLRALPATVVTDFCVHVDVRIREAVQHQRFPVQVLERNGHSNATGRLVVNFVPSSTIRDFAGASASALVTAWGRVEHFGLFFMRADGQLFLSTAGAGQPFSNFGVSALAARLERVLAVMVADPGAMLSSVDVLGRGEGARLDVVGNRAVLDASGVGVSVPVVFGQQVACRPEAAALVCG
ncbi:hypothetical protein B8W66_21430, partial [Mycobacterium decipiens]